jgi:hypothetical protein
MKLKNVALSVLFLLVLDGINYGTPPDQPFMEAARSDLQQAKAELVVAERNKGGHRAKAVGLVNSAIAEINRGIEFARTHNHAQAIKFNKALSSSTVSPDQPHMASALDHLKSARDNLARADADKGGHRAKAISLVDQAINEVTLGIAAGG